MPFLVGALAVLAVLLLAQSLFSLYLMLYSWEHPDRLAASKGPSTFLEPQTTFTVLLPARHEQAVIYETIRRVISARYPQELLEVLVVCFADDLETIAEATRAIRDLGTSRVRVETFAERPINKPHGLNVGLARSGNDVVTIFDAEDDIDADIFNVVNTVMLQEGCGIVQAGVQLMNMLDHWFSVHNCMEYFFWFKSRLHFHAAVKMVPLGGNTVFIRRDLLERVGGWDISCLTEDAEIGLRLSLLGEPIRVVYDAQHVTREETPESVDQFIRQRTRWHQGFLQVLRTGTWRRLPRLSQRLLAAYTFVYPLLQAAMVLTWPVAIVSLLWVHAPVPLVMLSFLPLYALLLQYLLTVAGAYQFCRDYQLRFPLLLPFSMAITYIPFQFLQGIAALRAVYRELTSQHNWEKTAHVGAHRQPAAVPFPGTTAYPALGTLLDSVLDHLDADGGTLLVRNTATAGYYPVSNRGISDTAAQMTRQLVNGVADWVERTRRPLILDGRRLPPELRSNRLAPERGSALVLPIEHEQTVVAMLYVNSTQQELSEEELHQATEHISRAARDLSSALPSTLGRLRAV